MFGTCQQIRYGRLWSAALVAVVLVAATGDSRADIWFQKAKLNGVTANTQLGNVVTVEGDWILAGSGYKSLPVEVRDFHWSSLGSGSWVSQALAPYPANRPLYGDVAIMDGTAFVGAPFYNVVGVDPSVLTYNKVAFSFWSYHSQLTPSAATGSGVGFSIATGGAFVAVGNPGNYPHKGEVYIWQKHLSADGGISWDGPTVIQPSDGQPGDKFGYSVDIENIAGLYRLVVGAPKWDNASGVETGAAYIFWSNGGGWTQIGPLSPSGLSSGANFGKSVAVATIGGAQEMLVGAPDAGNGKVYVYVKDSSSNWVESGSAIEGSTADFGRSLAASGEFAVVGSAQQATPLMRTSAGTWSKQTAIKPSTCTTSFGTAVAIDGSRIVIGDPGDDVGALNAGAVYVYDRLVAGPVTSLSRLESSGAESDIDAPVADASGTAEFALRVGPNPSAGAASITFRLPQSCDVDLRVYDVRGRLVKILEGGSMRSAGDHQIQWNGLDGDGNPMSAGLYFYRLRAGGRVLTERISVVR
jgi:hypothetical protein